MRELPYPRSPAGGQIGDVDATSPAARQFREVLMPRRKKRKFGLPGHYCWACDRRRANEKFSGRGHARHICRDCAKLGAKELAYRQARRDLQRCMTWDGIIPRKRRKAFTRFLNHDDPRIRALAEQMQAEDLAARGRFLADAELGETAPMETAQVELDQDRA